jgi:hypothetical protein
MLRRFVDSSGGTGFSMSNNPGRHPGDGFLREVHRDIYQLKAAMY